MRQLAKSRHRAGGLPGFLCILASSGAPADRHDEADFLAVGRRRCGPHHRDPSAAYQRTARGSLADLARLARRRRSEGGHRNVWEAARHHVSLLQKEVPHGRYLDVGFADGSAATIVLDQGFGAWAPPRHVTVRYDFGADAAAQVRRLATMNAVLQRRGIGKTYFVATSGKT